MDSNDHQEDSAPLLQHEENQQPAFYKPEEKQPGLCARITGLCTGVFRTVSISRTLVCATLGVLSACGLYRVKVNVNTDAFSESGIDGSPVSAPSLFTGVGFHRFDIYYTYIRHSLVLI